MHNLLVSATPEANLPQLSMTLVVNFATSTAGVIDTGATGINDTGGKFANCVNGTGGK